MPAAPGLCDMGCICDYSLIVPKTLHIHLGTAHRRSPKRTGTIPRDPFAGVSPLALLSAPSYLNRRRGVLPTLLRPVDPRRRPGRPPFHPARRETPGPEGGA